MYHLDQETLQCLKCCCTIFSSIALAKLIVFSYSVGEDMRQQLNLGYSDTSCFYNYIISLALSPLGGFSAAFAGYLTYNKDNTYPSSNLQSVQFDVVNNAPFKIIDKG